MNTSETDVQTTDEATETAAPEKAKLSLEVKIDKPSACQRHITVTISREDIDRYAKEAFDELGPKAEVAGFRAGRAPRKIVETRFKEQVEEQVKGKLLMDSMTQISDDHEFSAISEPDFNYDTIRMPASGPMVFEFDIEVRPEFDMPQWKGLTLERPTYTYTEEDVDNYLARLLDKHATLTVSEEPIQADDFVTLNIHGEYEGKVVSHAHGEQVQVHKILSFQDAKLENFDSLVAGKQAGGHFEATVTISPDAENEDVRGKEVVAKFDIVGVERRKLPELNEGFLDRLGGFESVEELRSEVRKELEKQLTYQQQRRVRQQITGLLTEAANWDLPPELLRRQARRELERSVMELRSSGFPEEVIRAHVNELQQNSMASTARALKEHFILERIAEDEKIEAESKDYDDEIEKIAEQSDESARRVRARLEKRGLMDTLRNQIIERKAIEIITSHASFNDTPFTPPKDETSAIDLPLGGYGAGGEDIPEAKHAGGTEEKLPGTIKH
jgi:trigger factor